MKLSAHCDVMDSNPTANRTLEDLRMSVAGLYERNACEGYSPLEDAHYCYVKPSPKKYPFQWFWDTFFHVFVLTSMGMNEVAQRNIRSLFLLQRDDGFVGHMIFWKRVFPTHLWDVLQAHPTWRQLRPHMSAVLQPCFAAQALERLQTAQPDPMFVGEMLPSIESYIEYVWLERRIEESGLLSIISPVESGMDYKPSFDGELGCKDCGHGKLLYRSATRADLRNFLRGYDVDRIRNARGSFIVQETTFNVAFALDLLALARLERAAGQHEEAAITEERASRLQAAIFEHLYDPEREAFFDHARGTRIPVLTVTTFFPLALPDCPAAIADRVLQRYFDDPASFALPYPLPTVPQSEPSFLQEDTWFLWRGPTWMMPNWLVHRALCTRGDRARAERLLRSSFALIERGGFREYYDPITGEGRGERDFTWAGLVLDMQRTHNEHFG